MENYRVNTNYAKALFLVACDVGELDRVCDDMRLVNSVCCENHILNTVFSNPVIREDKKVAIVRDIFEQQVSKVSMLFMSFVIRKRRAVNMKGISGAFIELYRKEKGIVLSQLQTATEIGDGERQSVIDAISRHTGKRVELQTTVDPDIIGGFSISFDHNMYDARLCSAISKLRKEFSKNVYESKL